MMTNKYQQLDNTDINVQKAITEALFVLSQRTKTDKIYCLICGKSGHRLCGSVKETLKFV